MLQQEAVLRVALTLYSNPGAYALLLGSGLSTAAGIPTGWDIVEALVRRLACAAGEKPDNWEAWYRDRFGEEPDYSRVLQRLATSQGDRMALLRPFFEPSEEEREAGRKLPTLAHRAIAHLVGMGKIRMILTTNFDRLIEQALEQEGIAPIVLSSPDAIHGAPPYAHGRVFVVKLHGDYRDTRIRNTQDELASYPEELRQYLDRILDDFGLIVCGWSGEWDTALRDAIFGTPNRRFATYWLARGELGEQARRVVDHRAAEVIRISDAETFLPSLLDKIEALQDLERPDPLDVAVAVATTKRYLAEDRYRIRLDDLIRDEALRVRNELVSDQFSLGAPTPSAVAFSARLRAYDGICEQLIAMVAAVSYYGRDSHGHLLRTAVRLITPERGPSGSYFREWERLSFYPALLTLYAAGIVDLAQRHFRHLAALLHNTFYRSDVRSKGPLIAEANAVNVFAWVKEGRLLPAPYNNRKCAGSDYLADRLRGTLSPYFPSGQEYLDAFDTFEYFFSLAYWHHASAADRHWAPWGSYTWRRWGSEDPLLQEFIDAASRDGETWGLFSAGFFNDAEGLRQVRDGFEQWARENLRRYFW